MIKRWYQQFVGSFSFFMHLVNTIIVCVPLFLLSILKLLLPVQVVRNFINKILDFLATSWISINTGITKATKSIHLETTGLDGLSTNDWYLVLSNHQSWADIFVLQQVFNRKIPFLKFFLKQELIWFPIIGLAWWALDFPFMKRYSKSYLKKHPHKKGKDLETTREACEKFQYIPISMMNFVEGTRFSKAKSEKQNSPYKYLLKPKSGGVGTVLSILGNQMKHAVDVTIIYPDGRPSFWDYICGRVSKVKIFVRHIDVDESLIGDMSSNETRLKVQNWLNGLWQEKDHLLAKHLGDN